MKLVPTPPDYSYQPPIIHRCIRSLLSEKEIVLAASCGAGKTRMAISIMDGYLKQSSSSTILVLTHGQTSLREQFYTEMKEVSPGLRAEMWSQGEAKLKSGTVTVALPHNCTDLHNPVDLLVVDEAHEYFHASMVQNIIKNTKPKAILLLTGSPSVFIKEGTREIISVSTEELMDHNVVCSPTIVLAQSAYDFTESDYNAQDDLKKEIKFKDEHTRITLDTVMADIHQRLTSTMRGYGKMYDTILDIKFIAHSLDKTLFVCNSSEQALQVEKYFADKGIETIVNTSQKESDGAAAIQRFKTGDVKIMVVIYRGVLGFNFPELVNVVDMSGTWNVDREFQLLCRLVRHHPNGKKKLFIKVTPESLAVYTHVFMSFVCGLIMKEMYESYDGSAKVKRFKVKKSVIEAAKIESARRIHREKGRKSASLPTEIFELPTFTQLRHEYSRSYSEYAYTTLNEVKKILRSNPIAGDLFQKEKAKSERFFRKNMIKTVQKSVERFNCLPVIGLHFEMQSNSHHFNDFVNKGGAILSCFDTTLDPADFDDEFSSLISGSAVHLKLGRALKFIYKDLFVDLGSDENLMHNRVTAILKFNEHYEGFPYITWGEHHGIYNEPPKGNIPGYSPTATSSVSIVIKRFMTSIAKMQINGEIKPCHEKHLKRLEEAGYDFSKMINEISLEKQELEERRIFKRTLQKA